MMSTLKLNRFGEIEIEGNDITYFAPVTNFANPNTKAENLESDYNDFLEKTNYNDLFAQINEFNEKGKYIEFDFHQENTSFYHTIRNIAFEQQLHYFRSLIEIAKLQDKFDVQILWQIENFILSTEENDEKIRALIYEFSEDMKVYDRTTALQGLKQTILSGLTKLNKVIGKPTKADFINKDQEVIDFAEEVLEASSIDSIELNVQNRIDIIEQKREEDKNAKQQAIDEKNKRKKLLPRRKKQQELKQESPKDQIKSSLKDKYSKDKSKKKKDWSIKGLRQSMFKNTKNTIITVVSMLVIVFLIMLLPSVTNSSSKQEKQKAQEQKVNNKITTIYRDYVNGNKDKAHQKMFALDYKKIPKKNDKKIYLKWLVEDQKYTKALDLNKKIAYDIGENINDKNIDQLKKINTNDKYKVLSFYIANHEKDFQTMIEMQNSVDLERKNVANALVQAYVLTNQQSELNKVLKKLDKDKGTTSKAYKNMNTAKQYYEDENNDLKDATKERDKAKEDVDKAKKDADKAKGKDKKNKEKEYDNAKDSLNNAEDRYDKQYNEILNTKSDDAIPNN